MKDRDEKSRGMEIRIAVALAKIKPTEPFSKNTLAKQKREVLKHFFGGGIKKKMSWMP